MKNLCYLLPFLLSLSSQLSCRKIIVSITFLVLLSGGVIPLNGQGSGLTDSTIQVMKKQLNTADNDTLKLELSLTLALHYLNKQLDSAKHYLNASYVASQDLNYTMGKAWTSILISYIFYLKSDYASTYQWINTSKSYSKEISVNAKDPIFEIVNLGNTWLDKTEAMYGLRGHQEQMTGHIYRRLGMNEEALDHYREQLRHLQKTNNVNVQGQSQWIIGLTYHAMDSLEKAESYLLQANVSIIDHDAYKGVALLALADLEETKGNNSKRYEYIQEAFKFNKKNNNYLGIAVAHHALGRYYYDQGDYDRSIAEYITADELDRKINTNYKGYDSMIGRAKCFKEKGELAKAYALNIEGHQLKSESEAEDQIHNNAFHKYILEENNELHVEQERLSQVSSRRRTIGLSLLAGLLSLIGIMLYRNNRQKQKSNVILEEQKEFVNQEKEKAELALQQLQSTQAQLIQSEKMASLGELTAGIAHEIQNPLNFVNNFSEVSGELIDEMNEEIEKGDLQEIKAISSDLKQNLEKISHHGGRASSIVKGMLDHSRTSSGERVPTDINALCDEYLRLSYHGLRAKDKGFNADFETDFAKNIPSVKVVPQDIGRVVLNLITNAFQAVNKRRQENDEPSYKPKVICNTTANESHVIISVSDNGHGIPADIKEKIFQPFFTTKPTGQGTGLGLSLAYDIVKAHDGELSVESVEGNGTSFSIELPLT